MSQSVPPYVEGHDLLAGKTVLITAAAGTGIGFATAKRCVEEGARVMISDIHARRLEEAVGELEKLNGVRPPSRLCNVSDDAEVRELIRAGIAELGQIDVLVNNAGLGGMANVVDMTDEQWDAVIGITLTGTFRMTRAVLPHMIERKKGVIVNNASVLGWRAQVGQAHYAAAKAGVNSLTATFAAELGPKIRVNCIMPGAVPTEIMMKALRLGEKDLPALEKNPRLPAGRLGTPEDVGAAALFLCSRASAWITGETLSVSGGM